MKCTIALFGIVYALTNHAQAQMPNPELIISVSVKEVTEEYRSSGQDNTIQTATSEIAIPLQAGAGPENLKFGSVNIGQILAIGTKVWNFLLSLAPHATYQTTKASILPEGIKSWAQLSGWTRIPIVKIYRAEFKSILGRVVESFDYRISFVYGGGYKGKGKFIGNLMVLPEKIQLSSGHNLNVTAEISDPINFGTEVDPVAGVSMTVKWDAPNNLTYKMNSAEYFIYGSGEVIDASKGL